MEKIRHRKHIVTIVALIATSAIFRLIMIGSQSLWLDEGFSLAMTDAKSINGTFAAIWSVNGGDKYQPVYFVLLGLWRAALGDAQVTLQLLSVIFGSLVPALLFMSIKPLFGYRHALLSATFLVCSAFCINYSQEVRPYSYLLFLATCQLLLFAPALSGFVSGRIRIVGFACITFLCCLSSVFLMLFSAVLAISFFICYRDIKLWVRWWGPAITAALPALLYFGHTPAVTDLSTDAINTTNVEIWQNTVFALYGHIAGPTYGPVIGELRETGNVLEELSGYYIELMVLFAICSVLALNTFRVTASTCTNASRSSPYVFFICTAALSFFMALAVAALTSINWMPRHSFYLMLPLAILLPSSIFSHESSGAENVCVRKADFSSAVAFAGLLLVNMTANSNYYFDAEHWRDDYRSAANYLNTNVEEGDVSIMLWGEPYLLEYYGHDSVEGLWKLEDAQLIISMIDAAVEEKNKVFVSINRESSWQRYSKMLHKLILEKYELVPAAEFNSFTSYTLEPRDQRHAAME